MSDVDTTDTGAVEQDQSMEEILQSIRKIIAEESDDAENGDDAEAPGAAVAEEPAADSVSDVLELTDVVGEETPAEPASDEGDAEVETPEAIAPEPVEETPAPVSEDVLSSIDQALTPETPEAPAPKAEERPSEEKETLLSEESAATASAALKSISNLKTQPVATTTPSQEFRSGSTVEDLVIEALRPMLKEWLDGNLPVMVERIVEREIRKLTE